MLLDVKDLAVTYAKNSKPTIEGVSFELDEGEILAFVGESGSGKTTVIRAILNVLPGGGSVSNGTISANSTIQAGEVCAAKIFP